MKTKNETVYTVQEDAAYRVNLKHMLRRAGFRPDNDTATPELEAHVRLVAGNAPKLAADFLDARFNRAAEAWIAGNNSGDNRTMAAKSAECDFIRTAAERVLALFGAATDYPGLYPSFKLAGYDHHSVLSVLLESVRRSQADIISDEDADSIGGKLAERLKLRRDTEHKDRWQTEWGTKTNKGLLLTVLRMAAEIKAGQGQNI